MKFAPIDTNVLGQSSPTLLRCCQLMERPGQLTAGRALPPPPHPACVPPARAPPRRPGRRGAAAGKTALAAAAGQRERRRPGWLLLVSGRATGFHVFVFYDRSAGARRGAEYRRTRNIVINTAVL